jgi:hypothetical protein
MNSPHKMHHPLPVFRYPGGGNSGNSGGGGSGSGSSTEVEIPHQIRGSLDTFTQSCPVVGGSMLKLCLYLCLYL